MSTQVEEGFLNTCNDCGKEERIVVDGQWRDWTIYADVCIDCWQKWPLRDRFKAIRQRLVEASVRP